MITFTPLSGDAHVSDGSPVAYILQIDDVKILLDCGSPDWNPESLADDRPAPWAAYCQNLKNVARDVDLVLLSHADLRHCGLFPYAFTHWNLRAPVYGTYPVQALGRIAVLEEVQALRDEQVFPVASAPDLVSPPDNDGDVQLTDDASVAASPPSTKFVAEKDDVYRSFDSLIAMRYSQPSHLQGKCQGITITPYSAGHTLGGTIWKIRSPSAGTIVYGVSLNHTRERHLDGTVLFRSQVFEPLARPDVFITDSERAVVVNPRRKDRDSALLNTITETLESNSVLLPVDSSARLLELLVLFDQHWTFSKLRQPICLVSKTGVEMLTFVRSMMEWFGGHISKDDASVKEQQQQQSGKKRKRDDDDGEDAIGSAALRFKHLEFFTSYGALMSTYPSSKPKLILAVPQSLSHGSSRAMFADFAAIPGNVVLLTCRGEPETLSRHLFDRWNERQEGTGKYGGGAVGQTVQLDESIQLKMHAKVPLHGAELEAYLQAERATKEREAAQAAALTRSQLMIEADESDSDDGDGDDSDDGQDDGAGQAEDPSGSGDAANPWSFDTTMDDSGTGTKGANYDFYVKGGTAKQTSFFKAAEGQGQKFKMFPYVERRRRVDAFGEVLDVGAWQRRGKALEENTETEEQKEQKRLKQAEEEAKAKPAEPPSKYVVSDVDVRISCRLFFVDMEGLNDSRAVKTIVPQVNPRKMILVSGTDDATNVLLESCSSITAMTKDIYTPSAGESVQIGQHVNNFSFSLSDALLGSLKMSRFEDTEVAFVHGRLVGHASSSIPILEPMLTISASASAPGGLAQLPDSTMIGDLKLTALRARLIAIGVPAEFAGEGVLVCGEYVKDPTADPNGVVSVRKHGRGQVEVDGGVSDTFFTVRKEVYALHAIVTPA